MNFPAGFVLLVVLALQSRFVHESVHINPSAGQLRILLDGKPVRELYGWELVTLPDESIVYHHSQIHFASTHFLEISVFNPRTSKEKQIYPPTPSQRVRREFVARVAQAYQQRGESWFRQNNHHMNPGLFDSRLTTEVVVDNPSKAIAFIVQFGDPENARDPLPFSEEVLVTCINMNQIERINCRERSLKQWRDFLRFPAAPNGEVLKRAAANPTLVP